MSGASCEGARSLAGALRVAVPSVGPGGLDAVRSEHFGRCDCFTIVECSDADIHAVDVIDNPPHSHGGCLRPVDMLAARGIDTLVVQGIGARPYAGLVGHGITVLRDSQAITVGGAIDILLCGSMPAFDASDGCRGHD